MNLRPLAYVALAGSAILLVGCETLDSVLDRSPGGAYAGFDRPGLGAGRIRDARSETREFSPNECH